MDNLDQKIQDLQNQIDALESKLTEAQNQKLTASVHLQNEEQEYNALSQQLQEITGISDLNEICSYIEAKEEELNSIINDLEQVSKCINDQYTFTDSDIASLKSIINKYNIPVVGE